LKRSRGVFKKCSILASFTEIKVLPPAKQKLVDYKYHWQRDHANSSMADISNHDYSK
jgi:hypothetical protein